MLSVGRTNLAWGMDDSSILFDSYASPEESQRGKIAVIESLPCPVTFAQVLPILKLEGVVINVLSDAIWDIAADTAFIPDWSEEINPETNERVRKLKTLNELGAQIIDV